MDFILAILVFSILIGMLLWDHIKQKENADQLTHNVDIDKLNRRRANIKSMDEIDDYILDALSIEQNSNNELEINFKKALKTYSKQPKQLKQVLALNEAMELRQYIDAHKTNLMRNIQKSQKTNEYGAIIQDNRQKEIYRFFQSIGYKPHHLADQLAENLTLYYIRKHEDELQSLNFEPSLKPNDGHDFEYWVSSNLVKFGWKASVTKASGDDGVDVIAERDGLRVAVQCKLYKGSVGNKAVQEVYTGMKHMQLDRAVVISTGQYTKAAQSIASTTGVLLLSEHDIPHLWDLLQR